MPIPRVTNGEGLTLDAIREAFAKLPRVDHDSIVIWHEDLLRLQKLAPAVEQPSEPQTLLGFDVVTSGYVPSGTVLLTRRIAPRLDVTLEYEPLFRDRFDPLIYRMPERERFDVLGILRMEGAKALDEVSRELRAWHRQERVRSRRRAKYLIRETVLARRLGVEPRPWRGK